MGNCFTAEDSPGGTHSRRTETVLTAAPSEISRAASVSTTPKDVEEFRQTTGNSNIDIFTYNEMKLTTKNFRPDQILGEGGFGVVYKGVIDENVRPDYKSTVVAVKQLDPEGIQGDREWLAEVNYLGQLSHPNLVKLIGYCCENEHRLLVYEYMPHGSLEKQLFRRVSIAMTWSTRMKIALGAAKGLAFLHESERPIIYRDFKTSNILLDADYNAKLSDFGLAKEGPMGDQTHVSTRVMGTYGYAAPEYVMTDEQLNDLREILLDFANTSAEVCNIKIRYRAKFSIVARFAVRHKSCHLTARSDVYGYGVVLLEMLIGRKAMDKSRPSREHNLVEWARPLLNHNKKLMRIIDRRMEGQYSVKAAQKVANLAYQCLSQNPKGRPTMSHVVEILEAFQTAEENPEDLLLQTGCGVTLYEVPKSAADDPTTPEGKKGEREMASKRANGRSGRSKSEPPIECDMYGPSLDCEAKSSSTRAAGEKPFVDDINMYKL